MKAAFLVPSLFLPLAVAAAEIRTGDSLNEVRSALGAPRGQLTVGGRQVLYYDRGEVDLHAGTVTRVALMSDADFAAVTTRRAAEAARLSEQNAQGEALKAGKLSDAAFAAAPAGYQLEFWRNFSQRYPGVSVNEQLLLARLRIAEQFNAQRANDARLAELEARVNEAEAQADSGPYRYASYVSDAGYYGGYRGRHEPTLWPVQYHFSNNPRPYANSPYPNRPTNVVSGYMHNDSGSNYDRRNSAGSNRGGRF